LKLEECKKIIRKLEFFAAIEVGDEPSAAEGLDLDSMVVEPDYDGVRLEKEMTEEFIDDMMQRFKNGKKIHRKYVYQIVIAVKQIVYEEPTMVEMEIPSDCKLTVCGDTHGRFASIVPVFLFGLTVTIRSILRLNGVVPIKRHTERETLLSFQRRLCRSRLLVNRNRPRALRKQDAKTKCLLHQPRQPRD
jgi:hypothetical protein